MPNEAQPPHEFYKWLVKQLTREGKTVTDLHREGVVSTATVQRWRRGEQPKYDMVRKVAKYLDLPLRRLLIISELADTDELPEAMIVPEIKLISDKELINELARRLGRRGGHEHPAEGEQRAC